MARRYGFVPTGQAWYPGPGTIINPPKGDNMKKVKDLVQEMIDKGATTVEQIHRSIADMPFQALEKIEPLEETVKSTKKIHDETVGNVYNIIRKVNEEVGKQADELLKGLDKLKGTPEGE